MADIVNYKHFKNLLGAYERAYSTIEHFPNCFSKSLEEN